MGLNFTCKKLCFLLLAICCTAGAYAQYNLTVAKDGSGDYTTVQAAINAAPTNSTTPYRILVKKGKYVEAVLSILQQTLFIQLVGESLSETIISYDNYSGKPATRGGGGGGGGALRMERLPALR